ncbi:ATP-binding protein [Aureisphaera galaxeae]|uniref:hybrid sensor histidine kinase/response regulator n=1 Tax=Aureisphaera galaxeae TaxID=1538023 RepID=UPI0023506537|nr:ATP-binding protein [Aureisphaera galaxeae]MDC8006100.1 ATP-binding protein [Aureisphaera galaxeae]
MSSLSVQSYDLAIINLNKAYRLANSAKYQDERVEVLFSITQVNYFIQNYDKAAAEGQRIITILENKGDKQALAEAHTIMGLITTRMGEFEKSEKFLRKADDWFTANNDEKYRAQVLLGFGILELEKEHYKNAVNYFDAALPQFEDPRSAYQKAFTLMNKSDALLYLSDLDIDNSLGKSKKAMEEALEIIEAKNYTRLEIDSYRIRSYIALREDKYALAKENMQIYETRNDSLYRIYINAVSKGIDAETEVGDLKLQIASQQDDINKQQRSINFGKMTTGLSIALIVILSLLTLSLYKNNNLRAKANELLQDKNNELQLAKEKAEKASLAKAQFLSTITHELRTPLYAVTGLTHLLLEEDPKPHQKEHLNSLKFSGEYLLSLINNILDLNKLEANKVEVEKTSFNLKKRTNDVLVALKKSADDRKNNLHFEFDESIPEKLMGDPLKLSQILINLIGNSLKFTQNGDVHVRIKKLGETKERVALRFEIEDNGVGISKKKQKSIFETFSQASLQINRKFGGTGLGLSIVKNLLELMGSKIQLESQLGKGSKFWFEINFAVVEEVKEVSNPQNIIYDVDYVALENRNILVVEDNKINQMITKKILEKNKMKCLVADNGSDAVALVKENNFDVVLMDIHMPGISGIEATQEIRKFNKDLPIIALTAVTIDENLDDFYRAGFNEIIPKPFKTEEFFEKIYRTLESRNLLVN